MTFNVDYDKLSELGHYFETKSDELDSLYNDLLGICDKIDENYKSEDSTVYLARFKSNIKNLVQENEDLRLGGQVLNDTSILYGNQELYWAKKVTQEFSGDRRTEK